jgi:hypothetical protein
VNAANAAPSNSNLTIQQMLTAFPQYSGLQDGWGGAFVENYSYEALQATVSQRTAHGLSFNFNFTFSKNIGDDGNFRSGWPSRRQPSTAKSNPGRQDRIDRSWTTTSAPYILNTYAVYQLPFGKGKIGSNNWLVTQHCRRMGVVRSLPIQLRRTLWRHLEFGRQLRQRIHDSECVHLHALSHPRLFGQPGLTASSAADPTVIPSAMRATSSTSISTHFTAGERFHGDQSVHGGKYITSQYLIGNAPRTAAYGIRNPGNQSDNLSIRRSFPMLA